jgi:hypothetical protein
MPTDKHRIAAYLPKEIDEKFQVFKQEREVGDSQALILLMSEYFGVSQQMTYSSDSPLVRQVEELSSLLSELKVELSTKIGEERIGELKSELLSELKNSSSLSKFESNSSKQLDIDGEIVGTKEKVKKPRVRSKNPKFNQVPDGVSSLTATQLEERLGVKKLTVGKRKYSLKDNPSRFIEWSKDKDPDGYGWEFRSDSQLFYKVAYQSNH